MMYHPDLVIAIIFVNAELCLESSILRMTSQMGIDCEKTCGDQGAYNEWHVIQ